MSHTNLQTANTIIATSKTHIEGKAHSVTSHSTTNNYHSPYSTPCTMQKPHGAGCAALCTVQ